MQISTTNLNKEKKINGPEMMIEIGKECAKSGIKKILLYGELGAGKTHFSKGFFNYFGIPFDKICSPTYTYVNKYSDESSHFDFYRLENVEDLIGKGLLDIVNDSDFIIIERPKREDRYIDEDFSKIYIEKVSQTERLLKFL